MVSTIELVLIPAIATGHLVSAVEFAKLLVARDSRLSVTVLLFKLPFESVGDKTAESLSSSAASERVKFVDLPRDEPTADSTVFSVLATCHETQKPHVREAVKRITSSGSVRVVGFILDMFSTAMIDVADEFGVPSYVFFTSGAGLLSLNIHMIGDEESCDNSEFNDGLVVPGFAHPIPKTVLPSALLNKAFAPMVQRVNKGIAKSKGVLVNTFAELEPGFIQALSTLDNTKFPVVYPIGPIINFGLRFEESDRKTEIMEWLDRQPASSVVFLCFGSMGSFSGDQVREIAIALERTGVRFLWSLRRPGEKDDIAATTPQDYEDPSEVLPEGFIERTAGIGKVVGWAPQVAVLGHVAVGGFVSHCGWNSVLESLWFGVPVATWPLYAEQHLNAFEMVTELGLATEISLEDRREFNAATSGEFIVKADEIERGIEKVMESESEIRKRVKEVSEKSRKASIQGGSSYTSMSCFINKVTESLN